MTMQKLRSVRTVEPTASLITIPEARTQVRWDDNVDTEVDGNLTLLIAAVMSHLDGVDGILGRALVSQTWVDTASGFPVGDELTVTLAPVISISGITYYDRDNVQRTFDPSGYSLHSRFDGGYIKRGSQVAWPATYDRDDAVAVTYVAGYGEAATDVPAAIKLAGLKLLAHWFDNPEAVLVGTISAPLPMGVQRLLRSYIRPHF